MSFACMATQRSKIAIALAAATITSVFFLNYCNAVFQCGCQGVWAQLDAHCNIHNPSGRHCPVCTLPIAGQVGIWAMMVIPQVLLAFAKNSWSTGKRLVLSVSAFPVLGLVPMVGLGLLMGYWSN